MVPVPGVPGKAAKPDLFEAGLAVFADGLTSSFVFVVPGHLATSWCSLTLL
jgi:hypothetical protein